MKSTAKTMIKKFLLQSGSLRAICSMRGAGAVVLRYHSVLEHPGDLDDVIGSGIVHSAELFEQQMRVIAESFEPVTMDDILEFAEGRSMLPSRAVAVTFDDGFADNATVAAPIMERHGVRGAFYVTTGTIHPSPPPWFIRVRRAFLHTRSKTYRSPVDGRQLYLQTPQQNREAFIEACQQCAVQELEQQLAWLGQLEEMLGLEPYQHPLMMSEEQIRRLDSAGHIVGSHSVSHCNMAHITESSLRREFSESKQDLERVLGKNIHHFSYPSPILQPHYHGATVNMSREVGYRTGVTCSHGLVKVGCEPLACRRIAVPDDLFEFCWSVESTLLGLSTR